MLSVIVPVVLIGTLVLGPIAWRVWRDRREEQALEVRAGSGRRRAPGSGRRFARGGAGRAAPAPPERSRHPLGSRGLGVVDSGGVAARPRARAPGLRTRRARGCATSAAGARHLRRSTAGRLAPSFPSRRAGVRGGTTPARPRSSRVQDRFFFTVLLALRPLLRAVGGAHMASKVKRVGERARALRTRKRLALRAGQTGRARLAVRRLALCGDGHHTVTDAGQDAVEIADQFALFRGHGRLLGEDRLDELQHISGHCGVLSSAK